MLVLSVLSLQHLVLSNRRNKFLHLGWSQDYFLPDRIGRSKHCSMTVEEILCLETVTRNLIYHQEILLNLQAAQCRGILDVQCLMKIMFLELSI